MWITELLDLEIQDVIHWESRKKISTSEMEKSAQRTIKKAKKKMYQKMSKWKMKNLELYYIIEDKAYPKESQKLFVDLEETLYTLIEKGTKEQKKAAEQVFEFADWKKEWLGKSLEFHSLLGSQGTCLDIWLQDLNMGMEYYGMDGLPKVEYHTEIKNKLIDLGYEETIKEVQLGMLFEQATEAEMLEKVMDKMVESEVANLLPFKKEIEKIIKKAYEEFLEDTKNVIFERRK